MTTKHSEASWLKHNLCGVVRQIIFLTETPKPDLVGSQGAGIIMIEIYWNKLERRCPMFALRLKKSLCLMSFHVYIASLTAKWINALELIVMPLAPINQLNLTERDHDLKSLNDESRIPTQCN